MVNKKQLIVYVMFVKIEQDCFSGSYHLFFQS